MEVRLRLKHLEEQVEGHEAHVVDTGGDPVILVKLPIPDGMKPDELMVFMHKQATLLKEAWNHQFVLVPLYPGMTCEMGVLFPNVDDLKECIRLLSAEELRELQMGLNEELLVKHAAGNHPGLNGGVSTPEIR